MLCLNIYESLISYMYLQCKYLSHSQITSKVIHFASVGGLYKLSTDVPYIYIWDSFHENGPSFIIIKSYKIAMFLNRNNFRTVKAINFLLSTLHTTPFLYDKIHFGVLHYSA